MSTTGSVPEVQHYACPRCGTEVTESWYGPCDTCRQQLRTSLGGQQRDVEQVAYEPKLNVTPNAVATKD